jgi:hypothetical protein
LAAARAGSQRFMSMQFDNDRSADDDAAEPIVGARA